MLTTAPVLFCSRSLYLNIWMPPDDSNSSAPRAVMLFFYGGSFKYGTAMLPLYDGSHFSSHGVVTVACNYRLNAFGYLGVEALRATDGPETLENAGSNQSLAAQHIAWPS